MASLRDQTTEQLLRLCVGFQRLSVVQDRQQSSNRRIEIFVGQTELGAGTFRAHRIVTAHLQMDRPTGAWRTLGVLNRDVLIQKALAEKLSHTERALQSRLSAVGESVNLQGWLQFEALHTRFTLKCGLLVSWERQRVC